MKVVTALALLAMLPTVSSAQKWSADEQSLIDGVRQCWDMVNTEVSPESLATHCRPADGSSYWWTPETAPHYFVSSWTKGLLEGWNVTLISQDLRPLRVQVDGEFGFIYFHGIRLYEAADGSRQTESWRGMEVWRRTGEGWGYFAGMGTPDALNQMG